MERSSYFLVVSLFICFENAIFLTQATELNVVEIRLESEIQEEPNPTSVEMAVPIDLINLQMTFKIIQKSLHGLQITLETIKTKQTTMHLSLLNVTRSLKTPSYDLWKILRDEKLFINDIRDVQQDITKMNRFISYWEKELKILNLEQVITHDMFSKKVMEVIKHVEKIAQNILKKLQEGQQILKQDIAKMKDHVNVIKTEIKVLLENVKNSEETTTKQEISTTKSIMEKGESVIELGKKLQKLKSNVENVKSDVRTTYYLLKTKHNLVNIAQNLSKMLSQIGDLNLKQLEIELESETEYPGKGVLPVKLEKLHKEVDNSIEITLAIEKKFEAVQDADTNKAELFEEIGNKLLYLSKNILETEAKLEVVANTIFENGQLLVRQGSFKEGVRDRFHVQGEILKNMSSYLGNIGENFEEIGKTFSELGTLLTENKESKFEHLGSLLIEYAIK